MQGTEYFEGDDERLMRLRWTNSLKNSILSARTLLEEGLTKMWEWAKNQPIRKRFFWGEYELEKGIYEFWKKE